MKPITPELRERLCSFIRAGATRVSAARSVGMTIEELREACDADQVFAAELEQAETDAVVATEIQFRQKEPRAWLRAQRAANPSAAIRAASQPKGPKSKPTGLNYRQKVFAREYVKDHNGEKAAIRAGYSAKSAKSTAALILTYPNLLELIRQEEARVLKAIEVTNERVLMEVAAVAFMDPGDLLDERGFMLDSHLIPSAIRRGFEFTEVYDVNTGQKLPALRRVRLAAKFRALEVLVKHLGLFLERPNETDGRFTIPQIRQVLEAWDERDRVREARKVEEEALLELEVESGAVDLETFRRRNRKPEGSK